ncbi:LacI family DNA-binding transcriptional regulator [Leifsonia shinshuensis]|uniref:LacI family transcriptional regulator n=1 Tax=Leifsonia shinshuensis TaxID=150026 RepID=A0A7G6YCW9_9MICO|nr:LacI family DNA-binding transcriptional regulator [Leifsonia shinshuensis]QNE36334.1 LacI family transcriptional regulator [Leifsonia shinshuensis]
MSESGRAPGVREVAAAAGVSRQTVSRVLNDHASIRPETRERVLAAMAELNFRPNRAARMLTTARSRTIGVLASSASSLFGPASSIDAVEQAARDAGYFVTVAHAASLDPADLGAAVDHLGAQSVEGVIVIAPQRAVQEAMAAFSLEVPSVTLHGAGVAGDDGVFVDQLEGARLATRHLLSLGHTRIAHLSGPGDWSEARARRDGFVAELAAAGLEPVLSREGDWTAASGSAIGAELLEDPELTAVFSSNDQMALGLLHAARERGRRVPEELAVVGFDDIPEAAYFAPPLTTVRQDFRELGRRGVARLVALIEGRELAFDAPVAPVLVVRASA